MIRVIKRYESRKLYDTEESRYVGLEDIARWVREGQEVQIIDNATAADATAQVLTQVILDEGKRGASFLPSDLLHELVRAGEKAMTQGFDQIQQRVERLLQKSVDRLAPVREARAEMAQLQQRLSELEAKLTQFELPRTAAGARRGQAKRASAAVTPSLPA